MRIRLTVFVGVSVSTIVVLSLAVRAQEKIAAQAMYNVHGPVRTLRVEEAAVLKQDDKLIEGPRMLQMTAQFNEDGNSTEACFYGENGALLRQTVTKFESGREVEVLNYYDGGRLPIRTVTVYDAQGLVKNKFSYNSDGSLQSKTDFIRDGGGRLTERAQYNANGSVMNRFIYTFDAAGQLKTVESTLYRPDGLLQQKLRHIVADRRIESVSYKADGTIAKTSVSVGYEINEFGADGSLRTTIQITDPTRLPVRSIHQPDGSMRKESEIADEIDAHGNWIKQTKWISDSEKTQPVKVIYRIITYY
jgi:antitoxin component YwqK of YwqJK toxin-antitoxin module